MSVWGRRGNGGASVRKRRSIGAITAIVAIVAIGLSVVAVSSADITNNTKLRSVDNNTAVTSGPGGSVLAIDVEYTIPARRIRLGLHTRDRLRPVSVFRPR